MAMTRSEVVARFHEIGCLHGLWVDWPDEQRVVTAGEVGLFLAFVPSPYGFEPWPALTAAGTLGQLVDAFVLPEGDGLP